MRVRPSQWDVKQNWCILFLGSIPKREDPPFPFPFFSACWDADVMANLNQQYSL